MSSRARNVSGLATNEPTTSFTPRARAAAVSSRLGLSACHGRSRLLVSSLALLSSQFFASSPSPLPSSSSSSAMSTSTVRASHLLIKHSGSRRPASWKDPQGAEITKRSKEDAIKILTAHREAIESGKAKFADLARVHSDCGSAQSGGDLGAFGRGAMQKPFEGQQQHVERGQTARDRRPEPALDRTLIVRLFVLALLSISHLESRRLRVSSPDATFALKVGEMSGIVDTDSGVHIILRTE